MHWCKMVFEIASSWSRWNVGYRADTDTISIDKSFHWNHWVSCATFGQSKTRKMLNLKVLRSLQSETSHHETLPFRHSGTTGIPEIIISINCEMHKIYFVFTNSNSSKLLHMHIMLGVTVMKTITFIMSANCWAQLQVSSDSFSSEACKN